MQTYVSIAAIILSIVLIVVVLAQVRGGRHRSVRRCRGYVSHPSRRRANPVPLHHCAWGSFRRAVARWRLEALGKVLGSHAGPGNHPAQRLRPVRFLRRGHERGDLQHLPRGQRGGHNPRSATPGRAARGVPTEHRLALLSVRYRARSR